MNCCMTVAGSPDAILCVWSQSGCTNLNSRCLTAGFQFGEDLLGDFLQGFEDADALEGDGLGDRFIFAEVQWSADRWEERWAGRAC